MDGNRVKDEITGQMEQKGLHPEVVEEFLRRVERVASGDSGKIPWKEIEPMHGEDYIQMESLPESDGRNLGQLAVIKLNGGLGTSMGLDRSKSIIRVKEDLTFLGIIKKQIQYLREKAGVSTPLLFMNSFNTREDTLSQPGIAGINQNSPGDLPVDFLQNMVPRIRQKDLMPLGDGSQDHHWCPPGHGDIYLSLKISGILERMLEAGYRVAFISNADNLGATTDPRLLDAFLKEKLEFALEVTPKTRADLKGGVLFRRRSPDGSANIELLELAQVEEEHVEDFQDVKRFSHFNTNSLWIHLEALRDRLKGGLPLSLIVNPKTVDGVDVYQLETAMGAAIGNFDRTRGFVVPRSRFAPVKSCADLLVRRSDAYRLEEDYSLTRDPALPVEPVIKLSDDYKKLKDFERLVPTPPSLKGAEELVVEGPVRFDRPISIQGTVKLRCGSEKSVGELNLEKLVSGEYSL